MRSLSSEFGLFGSICGFGTAGRPVGGGGTATGSGGGTKAAASSGGGGTLSWLDLLAGVGFVLIARRVSHA